jgi:hypothetical protein
LAGHPDVPDAEAFIKPYEVGGAPASDATARILDTHRGSRRGTRHPNSIVQRYTSLLDHQTNLVDQSRCASRERRAVCQRTEAVFDAAWESAQLEPGSYRQSRTRQGITDERNSFRAFAPKSDLNQRRCDMETIAD